MTDSRHPDLNADTHQAGDSARPFSPAYAPEEPAVTAVLSARHLQEYLRVLYRRRHVMLATFLVIVIGTVVYTYTRVPIYEARAKLLIESTHAQYVPFGAGVDPSSFGYDYYQTQYDLLKSRTLARRTLRTPELWARFGGSAGQQQVGSSGTATAETPAETQAIDGVLGGLVVAPVRNSRIVDLKYKSADPALATTVVNAHARSFVEQDMEFKFTASKEASDWLAAQLSEQRGQVEQASAALQRYREEHDTIVGPDDGDNMVIQKLGDLTREGTRAKTLRLEKEAVYNQLRATEKDSPALDTYPAVLSNPVVQQQQTELAQLQRRRLELSQTYLETHPEMEALLKQIGAAQTRLRGEVAKVVQGVRNEYLAAVAQEQSLSQALNAQKHEALAMNKTAIGYGVLSREVESTRAVYETLLKQAQETGVSGTQRTSNVRIVDLAQQPSAPVYPNGRVNVTVGILGGLALALFVALLFESFDNRLRTPDELVRHLDLPSLGLLPIEASAQGGRRPGGQTRLSARFAESMRTFRTNVLFSTGESACRAILITSTGPGEGKTTVSSNLALSLAEAGLRVLAIDADLRKPNLHIAFNTPQEPGLSNLMVGNAKAGEAIVETTTPGLWLLPAGHIAPNPAELLGSPRFREFLNSLRSQFDWVIVDTPPVMAVTDASLIAHLMTGVVFVVGSEMTNRHHAAVALEQLYRTRAKVLGGVLNRVDVDSNAYNYSPYYHRDYVQYYQTAPASAGGVEKV